MELVPARHSQGHSRGAQIPEEETGLDFWNLSVWLAPHQLRHPEILFYSEEGMGLGFSGAGGQYLGPGGDSACVFSKCVSPLFSPLSLPPLSLPGP